MALKTKGAKKGVKGAAKGLRGAGKVTKNVAGLKVTKVTGRKAAKQAAKRAPKRGPLIVVATVVGVGAAAYALQKALGSSGEEERYDSIPAQPPVTAVEPVPAANGGEPPVEQRARVESAPNEGATGHHPDPPRSQEERP